MKSLGLKKQGANPVLQLSCMNVPTADPEFYHLWDTIVSFRACHTPELSDQVIRDILEGQRPTPGPCKSLLIALQKLAWEWSGHGWVLDQNRLPLHLTGCTPGELFSRCAGAWQQRCLTEVESIRVTMKGLGDSDVMLTLQCWKSTPWEQQGPLRCMLNGTQYTNDSAVHTGYADTTQCHFCEHTHDSAYHRMWQCPTFQTIRDKYPQVVQAHDDLSEVTRNHAWLPRFSRQVEFHQMLLDVQDTSGCFALPHRDLLPDTWDIFTDGSCMSPAKPAHRVATWGMVIWTGQHFWPAANGVVTGWRHTSLRGELTAMLAALNCVIHHQVPARLWTDSQTVYNVLVRWLSNQHVLIHKRPDRDLWEALFFQFRRAYPVLSGVYKVQAHCISEDQDCYMDSWAVDGNTAADRSAERARGLLGTEFWQLRDEYIQHDARMLSLGSNMMQMFGEISLAALSSRAPPALMPVGHATEPEMAVDTGLQQLAQTNLQDIPVHFHVDETPFLVQWLHTLMDPNVPQAWVSFHQLLIDYQQVTGRQGPRSIDNKWRPVGYKPREYNHQQHVNWLSRWIINVAKHMGTPVTVQQRRPASHMLAFWTGCLTVRLPLTRLRLVDDHLLRHSRSIPARQIARDLGGLVPADRVTSA
eukprot:Skav203607  [mRNA]  locus=scaffold935:366208:368130:+ [translate_table: standard]